MHYAWKGRNIGEGQGTFCAQFAAESFTFCIRGNSSVIRKLSASSLGLGSSIRRSPCHFLLQVTEAPPTHDLKTYGACGGKALMQLQMAMDGGDWRPSGWPLNTPEFRRRIDSSNGEKCTTSDSALFMRWQIRRPSCNVNSARAGVNSTDYSHASTLGYPCYSPFNIHLYFHSY